MVPRSGQARAPRPYRTRASTGVLAAATARVPGDALLLLLQNPRGQGDCGRVEERCGCLAASLTAAQFSIAPARPPISRAADLAIRGTLHSVDQFLNIKLLTVSVEDSENFPHMVRRCAGSRLSLGRAESQPSSSPGLAASPLALSPSAASTLPQPQPQPGPPPTLTGHRSSIRSNQSRTASSAARSSDMCSSHQLKSTPSYCKMRRGARRLSRRTANEAGGL